MKNTDIQLLEEMYQQILKEYSETTKDGYVVRYEDEMDYDTNTTNVLVQPPNSDKAELLDISPYSVDLRTVNAMINFHRKHGRFPTRQDVGSIAPLTLDDLEKLK